PRPGRTRSYGTLGTGHGGAGHCLAPDPGRRTGARDTVGARARRDRTAAATADRAARTAAPTDRPGPVVPGTPGDAGHRPGRGGAARRGGRRGRGGLPGRAVERPAPPLRSDDAGRLTPVQLAVYRRRVRGDCVLERLVRPRVVADRVTTGLVRRQGCVGNRRGRFGERLGTLRRPG